MQWRVIKEGDLFLLTDSGGDILVGSSDGLYTRDTQFLGQYQLKVADETLVVLASSSRENYRSSIRLTNRQGKGDGLGESQGTLGVERRRLIYGGVLYERIILQSHSQEALKFPVTLAFGSRFADLFELRGARRTRRGQDLPPQVGANQVVLGYQGLDEHRRELDLHFAPAPERLTAGEAVWNIELAPGERRELEITVLPRQDGQGGTVVPFAQAEEALERSYGEWRSTTTSVEGANAFYQAIMDRSLADMRVLLTDLGYGPYPAAGIPWFATPFGRDAIIAALQLLMYRPDMALGTLRTLTALQGQIVDPSREEQPGKILHEIRFGEMANLGEVPFKRYYGSVDSTPLLLLLYVEYIRWTGDLAAARELLPNIRQAIDWVQNYGDVDGDGFVEFHKAEGGGLAVQSWKDSGDSMTHATGERALSPMAVSEAQGYIYAAYQGLAAILPHLGEAALAEELGARAERLRVNFEERFWLDDLGFYAMALDKDKRPLAVLNSDAGHCLFTGIVSPERAAQVAAKLTGPELFSGWGIRTLGTAAAVYNPMSYHNGSVWPHDNSLAVVGLQRYGLYAAMEQVTEGLFAAARFFPDERLPELFCGYTRTEGEPVPYPVACSPQAWAAGTPLLITQALLGVEPDALAGQVRLAPHLPAWLPQIKVAGLRVGDSLLDFTVTRQDDGSSQVEDLQVQGDIQVLLVDVPAGHAAREVTP